MTGEFDLSVTDDGIEVQKPENVGDILIETNKVVFRKPYDDEMYPVIEVYTERTRLIQRLWMGVQDLTAENCNDLTIELFFKLVNNMK